MPEYCPKEDPSMLLVGAGQHVNVGEETAIVAQAVCRITSGPFLHTPLACWYYVEVRDQAGHCS